MMQTIKACTIEKDEMVFIVEMVKFTRSFMHGTYDKKGLEQVAKRLFNAKPMEKGLP
jgi:hypothetical protein